MDFESKEDALYLGNNVTLSGIRGHHFIGRVVEGGMIELTNGQVTFVKSPNWIGRRFKRNR